jgi:hypothetical protein
VLSTYIYYTRYSQNIVTGAVVAVPRKLIKIENQELGHNSRDRELA